MTIDGAMPWMERSADEPICVGAYVRVASVGEVTVVFATAMPIRRLARGDVVGLRAELAALEAVDVVSQADVARSGLVSEATFHRDCVAYREGGDEAVRRRTRLGTKEVTKLVASVVETIRTLHLEGASNVAVGAKVGVSEGSVRGALRRLGLVPVGSGGIAHDSAGRLVSCPSRRGAGGGAERRGPRRGRGWNRQRTGERVHGVAEQRRTGRRGGASDRRRGRRRRRRGGVERRNDATTQVSAQRAVELVLARLGQIEEQSALFPPLARVPHAGVLLALAVLSTTGLLEEVRRHLPTLPNGLYGKRSIVTTLVVMALLRCKRPEQLKGFRPDSLGAVVGLARAPEMKTLRRKINLLAEDEPRVRQLVLAMAKRHVERVKDATAFLYIDGHVRPYFGKQQLGKTHVTQMRIALPATTDYWVCDATGAPVLVVVSERNSAMTREMPPLLKDVRTVVGPDARPTVVFDRGGFSQKLFKEILAANFDFLTYRKGKQREFPRSEFVDLPIRRAGRDVVTKVRDRSIRLANFGLVRCVAVLRPDGKQTHVLTSRKDLTAREVLERMFSRWQQENFFKYLSEQYAFDALWTYAATPADAQRLVPNPLRRDLDRKLAELRRQRALQNAHLGQLVRTKGCPATALGLAKRAVTDVEQTIALLVTRRRSVPTHVAVGALSQRDVLELARAPMLLGDVIKMTAFHIESMLVANIIPHLRRAADEARAVVADLFLLDGAIQPHADHVLVTLDQASAPRYTRALDGLCTMLNEADVAFPATSTRLRFRVASGGRG